MKKYITVTIIAILLVSCSSAAATGNPVVGATNAEIQYFPTLQTVDTDLAEVPVTPSPETVQADLPDFGSAPELNNQVWVNTDGPLRLADLRDKVVLLEMWTFG